MKRDYLFKLFQEAHRLTGHRDFVVIGSLSILGTQDEDELPLEMSMSIDIDAYTKSDPVRIHDVAATLGEGSDFHRENGYYLDPVSPSLPALPEGWQARMNCLAQGNVNIWFLDPDDAAMSKYARSQPNDLGAAVSAAASPAMLAAVAVAAALFAALVYWRRQGAGITG